MTSPRRRLELRPLMSSGAGEGNDPNSRLCCTIEGRRRDFEQRASSTGHDARIARVRAYLQRPLGAGFALGVDQFTGRAPAIRHSTKGDIGHRTRKNDQHSAVISPLAAKLALRRREVAQNLYPRIGSCRVAVLEAHTHIERVATREPHFHREQSDRHPRNVALVAGRCPQLPVASFSLRPDG